MPILKPIQRWTIGAGGFIGEVSLFPVHPQDAYVGADCTLSNFHVHPLRRGQGWGRALMDTALEYAARRQLDVFLRAVPYGKAPADLEGLLRLYRSYGFRQVRRNDKRELILRW